MPFSENDSAIGESFAGRLLVAHPGMADANFSRTVVLISAHTADDGAVGVVVNRPLDQTLGGLKPDFLGTPLSDVPLYYGGPVGGSEIILTAWRTNDGDLSLHFGISAEQAEELVGTDPSLDVRGFMGYAGWGGGQLEGEVRDDAWVLSPIVGALLQPGAGLDLWKCILRKASPQLAYMADMPDDPSVN
jgi:putative transcriptional regulator